MSFEKLSSFDDNIYKHYFNIICNFHWKRFYQKKLFNNQKKYLKYIITLGVIIYAILSYFVIYNPEYNIILHPLSGSVILGCLFLYDYLKKLLICTYFQYFYNLTHFMCRGGAETQLCPMLFSSQNTNKGFIDIEYFKDHECKDKDDSASKFTRKAIDFRSCGFLKLEHHPKVVASAKEMIDRYGTANYGNIRMTVYPLMHQLTSLAEKIFKTPILITQSVTLGHLSVIPPLMSKPGNVILMDKNVHHSIKLAILTLSTYITPINVPHNDMDSLERLIKSNKSANEVWYFCDGIYSMEGMSCPVDSLLCFLKKYSNFHLYVDDCHGTYWPVNGPSYVFSKFGLKLPEKTIMSCTMSKTGASSGALFLLPNQKLKTFLSDCGPPLSFSAFLNPSSLGASIAIANMYLNGELEERKQHLQKLIDYRNEMIKKHDIPNTECTPSPISIMKCCNYHCTHFPFLLILNELVANGFAPSGAVFPATDFQGIRVLLNYEHTEEQIINLLLTFKKFYYKYHSLIMDYPNQYESHIKKNEYFLKQSWSKEISRDFLYE